MFFVSRQTNNIMLKQQGTTAGVEKKEEQAEEEKGCRNGHPMASCPNGGEVPIKLGFGRHLLLKTLLSTLGEKKLLNNINSPYSNCSLTINNKPAFSSFNSSKLTSTFITGCLLSGYN